jgi:glutathione synthase/RimK-type ligase-like ATP-grasp enzyme
MPRVAFATYRQEPGITADDAPVADALRRAGIAVTAAVWDDAGQDWSRFDVVVIRSVWDYFLKVDPFERWVRSFSSAGPRLWNPPEQVLWNVNKRYLLDLAARGVPVVPTHYLTASDGPILRDVLNRRGWDEAVVKPAVGAGAYGAWRTSRATARADQARLAEQLGSQDVLAQAYMPEVASGGEWSLVFLGGEYSHAVRKRPAGDDFRVQEHLGGSAVRAEPEGGLIEQARAVLAAVGPPLLYARVDGVERDGRLILMELEINEPSLFLGLAPGSGQRFAEAILRLFPEQASFNGAGPRATA